MSDTWNEIQSFKSKHSSLREKLQRRKKERQEAVAGIIGTPPGAAATSSTSSGATTSTAAASLAASASPSVSIIKTEQKPDIKDDIVPLVSAELLQELERKLLVALGDFTLNLPVNAGIFSQSILRSFEGKVQLSNVEDLLQKLAAQTLISVSTTDKEEEGQSKIVIETVDTGKVSAAADLDGQDPDEQDPDRKRKHTEDDEQLDVKPLKQIKKEEVIKESVESLLSMQSAKEKETKKTSEEILTLLSTPTAKEQSLVEKFKSQGGAQVKEFCPNGTREECIKVMGGEPCDKLHFRKIIHNHTDESLGDCSFLNTCFHMDTCKYVHYEIDYPRRQPKALPKPEMGMSVLEEGSTMLFPPQWIQCDVRQLDMNVLGKFAVVMADPPWDIHMELPYGTMSDNEMRNLSVPILTDDGYIFLWVTGRAMELGRECLKLWGYERIDELIWVKTNQLQRIIRTGRTGHWLNHGKEHCLVGRKGNPKNVNRGLDCDVIVAEVRATSHKPDEVYGIIERLSPGTRKIELFGRPHNVQPNWITLGNQLDGVKLLDPEVVKAFKKRYPDGNIV